MAQLFLSYAVDDVGPQLQPSANVETLLLDITEFIQDLKIIILTY